MRSRTAKLIGIGLLLAGCGSETMAPAVPFVGVAGAGIKAEIVGVAPASDGYQFKVTETNLDVTSLPFDGTCDWGVDQLVDGTWVSLYRMIRPCYSSEVSLAPGQVLPQTLAAKTPGLPAGTQLRVWTGSHTTAPITL